MGYDLLTFLKGEELPVVAACMHMQVVTVQRTIVLHFRSFMKSIIDSIQHWFLKDISSSINMCAYGVDHLGPLELDPATVDACYP
jgi:hypothetical protein